MDFHVITSVGEALILTTRGDDTRARTVQLISDQALVHYRRVMAAHLARRQQPREQRDAASTA